MKARTWRIKTTLGELVTALTDAALNFCREEKEAYLLVSLAIEELFRTSPSQHLVFALVPVRAKLLLEECRPGRW